MIWRERCLRAGRLRRRRYHLGVFERIYESTIFEAQNPGHSDTLRKCHVLVRRLPTAPCQAAFVMTSEAPRRTAACYWTKLRFRDSRRCESPQCTEIRREGASVIGTASRFYVNFEKNGTCCEQAVMSNLFYASQIFFFEVFGPGETYNDELKLSSIHH